MSTTFSTWIRIGGQIDHKIIQSLLQAISAAGVHLQGCNEPFIPRRSDHLLTAICDDSLWLYESQSSHELPYLEQVCRHLGLSYTRFSGAAEGFDVELVDWRPEMKNPLVRVGKSADWDRILVDVSIIRQSTLSALFGPGWPSHPRAESGLSLAHTTSPFRNRLTKPSTTQDRTRPF